MSIHSKEQEEQQPLDLSGARVLLLDDEAIIHDAVEAILECDLARAHTVAEALAFEGLEEMDLILCDKNLPDGSGLDVVRTLKARFPEIEFLIVTGYPSLQSAIEAVDVGAFDYIPKPFDANDLLLKARNAAEKTRLTRAQARLFRDMRESETRHRAVFESSSDAIVLVDASTREIFSANRAAEVLYGYNRRSLCGLLFSKLLADGSDLAVERPLSGQEVVSQTHRRRDQTEFHVEVTSNRVVVDGREAEVLAIRDISERIRSQRERAQVEQRLRKSEKMEALGQLAAGIAHDFNNLLVVFMGASNELEYYFEDQNPEDLEDARAAVTELDLTAKSATQLTRQLLGFSRRQMVASESIDVAAVVEGAIKLLRRTLEERIKIELEVQDGLHSVVMDRGQLEQVITNLAINARDAMPRGGTLRVSASNGASADGQAIVLIRVADTGAGIAPEHLERIFEPFYTTKGPEQGTGLGLATVYGIVKSVKGEITVQSTLEQGTTFELRFLANAGIDRHSPVRSEANGEVLANGERVLLVEDHGKVRSAIARVLIRAGYSVVCAQSSEEALDLVANSPRFDLLLTDLGLPEMQGDELAQRVTEAEDIRVLCMSAYAIDTQSVHTHANQNIPFIAKPFDGERLLSRVRDVLGAATHASL